MAMLGGSQALYGPAVPGFQRAFDADVAAAGLGLPVHATASFLGVMLWGMLERREHRAGPVLSLSAALFAAGALAVAAAGSLTLALAAIGLVGLGFGTLMTGVNTLVARDPRPTAPALINTLHAMFGLGAVLLPLVLSVGGFRTAFVVVAVGALAVLAPLWAGRDPAPRRRGNRVGTEGPDRRSRVVVLFAALYVSYLGVEAGLANWIASHLTDLHWSETAAARWTAAFWLTFTLGRLAVAPLTVRSSPARVVRTALSLGAVTLVVANVDAAAPWAFVAAGLVLAPVFPTGLVWLARAAPEVRSGTTYMMLAGSLGAAALPALVGVLADALGVQVVPTVLAGFAVVAASVAAVIARGGLPGVQVPSDSPPARARDPEAATAAPQAHAPSTVPSPQERSARTAHRPRPPRGPRDLPESR